MNFNPGLLEVNGLWQGREDESLLYKFIYEDDTIWITVSLEVFTYNVPFV